MLILLICMHTHVPQNSIENKEDRKNIKIKEKPRGEIYELKRDMRRKILSSFLCSFECNLSQPAPAWYCQGNRCCECQMELKCEKRQYFHTNNILMLSIWWMGIHMCTSLCFTAIVVIDPLLLSLIITFYDSWNSAQQ